MAEGASTNYAVPENEDEFPFQRTQILTIPDAIFAQYNSASLDFEIDCRNTGDDTNGIIS
jgi:hypothetical protein